MYVGVLKRITHLCCKRDRSHHFQPCTASRLDEIHVVHVPLCTGKARKRDMNMSFKNNVRLQCFNGSNNAADLVISYQTNIVCAPLCMQFILTSQRNDARQADRKGSDDSPRITRPETRWREERSTVGRSPKTTATATTFLEADNDTFLAPNLFSPAAPRGDH